MLKSYSSNKCQFFEECPSKKEWCNNSKPNVHCIKTILAQYTIMSNRLELKEYEEAQ
jgi:hypothetical protein